MKSPELRVFKMQGLKSPEILKDSGPEKVMKKC